MNKQWERTTSDNVNRTTTTLKGLTAGHPTLTFWAVDPVHRPPLATRGRRTVHSQWRRDDRLRPCRLLLRSEPF
ncbi:hypothetical protein [Nocardioides nematodiphilus]|uniref:hypothetical protein n=1 Tax=Nocardioides nematodiphilus TaxID=2849669 RepID=UPI001CD94A4A|nr:hypothetical protein [Nocardioides nematodiphilus]